MKTSTIYLMLCAAMILCSGMQCKKDPEEKKRVLPEATQVGKGTFGCMVNNELWLPEPYSGPYPMITISIQSNILNLFARKNDSSIRFGIIEMNGSGTYMLYNREGRYSFEGDNYRSIAGKLVITRDDIILSGIFDFVAVNEKDQQDTVYVTDGRFDLRF